MKREQSCPSEARRLHLRTEGPLFLYKPASRPSDSVTRILPWALCQGGRFLQPRMTMGGCSLGLTWVRLSERHRGSLEPGWKQKRIRTIEWLRARLGSSHPSSPRASLLVSQPASGWRPRPGRGARSRASVLLVYSSGSGMLSTAVLVREAEKREPGDPSPLLEDLAPFPASLKPAHLLRASWSARTRVANCAPKGGQKAVPGRIYSLPERCQNSRCRPSRDPWPCSGRSPRLRCSERKAVLDSLGQVFF